MLRFILIFLLTPIIASAQHAVVVGRSKYLIDYQKHKGYIILNSGEKITGTFEYATWEFPTFNLKYYDENGKVIKRFKTSQINKAVFYGADKSLTDSDSTYFIKLNNESYLSRQLTDGTIKVYDDLINTNERPGLIKTDLTVYFQEKVYHINSETKLRDLIQKISPSLMITKESSSVSIIKQLNSNQY